MGIIRYGGAHTSCLLQLVPTPQAALIVVSLCVAVGEVSTTHLEVEQELASLTDSLPSPQVRANFD